MSQLGKKKRKPVESPRRDEAEAREVTAKEHRGRWLPLPVIAAVVLTYVGSLSGPFILDDLTSIPENPHVRRIWPPWEAMTAPPDTTVSGRPVVSLSLALNYAVCGFDVRGYHVFNLAVHVLSALLLLGIVRRTLEHPALRNRVGSSGPWLATAVAMIWAVHPLQTDAVTYVIQRTELIMGLFYLLTLYCAIRGWSSRRPHGWFVAAIAACTLGMGSKEVMVSAPLTVLLYDRMFISGSFVASLRRHSLLYAGLALTWFVLIAVIAPGPRSGTVGFGHGITPWDYLKTQAGMILWYVRLCFWPNPLVVYYDWPIASAWADWLVPGLIIAGLLALTLLGLWRRSWWGFVGAWFFVILAPTSSFVPISTEPAAERRMYLPLAAVVVLVLIGVWHVSRRVFSRRSPKRAVPLLPGGLATATVILLGYGTVQRNKDFRSTLAVWTDAVAKRPHSVDTRLTLGNLLYEAGRTDEAIRRYTEVLEIDADHVGARYNLANALVDQGRIDDAVSHYEQALRLEPQYVDAHNNLGRTMAMQGRFDEAMGHLSRALELDPNHAPAHVNVADILARLGETDQAIAHCIRALEIDPDSIPARMKLADMLLDKGAVDEAANEYRKALDIRPDHPDAHCNLGIALAMQKRTEEAIQEAREALRLQPHHAGARGLLDALLEERAARRPD